MQNQIPSVTFNQKIIGPTPFRSFWRSTAGIAGVFSRGPVGPLRITDRNQFISLYGEDNSPGSVAMRAAILQGATDFIVRRIVPSRTEGSAVVSFIGSNPLEEAYVNVVGARTVGLLFDASYISSPTFPIGSFAGGELDTQDVQLNLPNFTGTGQLSLEVIESIVPSSLVTSGPFTIKVINISNATGNVQIATLNSSLDQQIVEDNVKPGVAIKLHGTDVSGGSLGGSPSGYLNVLSYPFDLGGVTAFYVSRSVSAVGVTPTNIVVTAGARSPSDPEFSIHGYRYIAVDGAAELVEGLIAPFNSYGLRDSFQGFAVVPHNNAYHEIPFITSTAGTLALVSNTAVRLRVANPNATAQLDLVPGTNYAIGIVKSGVSVGDIDTLAVGFPRPAIAFSPGLSAVEILQTLQDAILQDSQLYSLFSALSVNTIDIPYNLTLGTAFNGAEANRVKFKLTRTVSSGTPSDLLYGAGGALYGVTQSVAGGQNGATSATRVLFDATGAPNVLIEGISPGAISNKVKISVIPLPPRQFQVEIVDEGSSGYLTPVPSEIYTLATESIDPQTGLFNASLDSNIVRIYHIPTLRSKGLPIPTSVLDSLPVRLAPPVASVLDTSDPKHISQRGTVYLRNFYLTGGSEPANYNATRPEEEDVLAAVRDLEQEDIFAIALPGIQLLDSKYDAAIAEVIAQAQRATPLNGMRIAILAAPPRLRAAQSSLLARFINNPVVVVVSGYSTLGGTSQLGFNAVSPDGFYLGQLATLAPQVSPADGSSTGPLVGVTSVDTDNSPANLNALTTNHIEVLYFDRPLGMYKFLNGVSSSSNPYHRYISITRMEHQIMSDLYASLAWVRSQSHTINLRKVVADSVDAYLASLRRADRIFSFRPTICDESNNSIADVTSGRMNIHLTYTPVYPADYIIVELRRDLSTDLTLQTLTV